MPPFPEAPIPNRRTAMQPPSGTDADADAPRAWRAPRTMRIPSLDAVAPMDAAEAFRDLPGLALLESARPGRTGRWSFLTADPVAVIDAPAEGPDPFAEARALLARMDAGAAGAPGATGDPSPPPFAGGLVGYLGYDLGRRFEHLPSIASVDQHLPVMRLALHDWAIAWDRRDGAAWLGVRDVDGDDGRARRRVREVLRRLDALERGEPQVRDPAPDASALEESTPSAFVSRHPPRRLGATAWRPSGRPSAAARSTRPT